jgi:hypothetical protein
MSLSLQHTIKYHCFTKEIIRGIMGDAYSECHHRVISYDDIEQEMQTKKMRSKNKLFGGKPQVVHLKRGCTGTHKKIKRNYPIDYVFVDRKERRNWQSNTILIIKLKKAKERAAIEADVDIGQVHHFGAFSQSSYGSSIYPPSPSWGAKKRSSVHHGHEMDNDNNKGYGNGDSYGGCRGGGGRGGSERGDNSGNYILIVVDCLRAPRLKLYLVHHSVRWRSTNNAECHM